MIKKNDKKMKKKISNKSPIKFKKSSWNFDWREEELVLDQDLDNQHQN